MPIALGDVFFAAVGADLFLQDFAAVFSNLLSLPLFPVGFGACFFLCDPLRLGAFLLLLHLCKFFLGVGNVDLSGVVEININLLCSGIAHALRLMHDDFINHLPEHGVTHLVTLLIFVNQCNELVDLELRLTFLRNVLLQF